MKQTNVEAQINDLLREYIFLKDEIRIKTKRLSEIQTWLKSKGTFSTDLYVCAVKLQTRTGLAGLEVVAEAIGRAILEEHDLIRVSEFLLVNVSAKVLDLGDNHELR